MSKRRQMPGLRLKGDIWHIEKRCEHCLGGWLRESTGQTRRAEAERVLIQRLAELADQAGRVELGVHTFEEAGLRYLEEIAHKPSADDLAMHMDTLLPFIGQLPLDQVHDGTLKPFVDHEVKRGLAPKSINNGLGVVSAVINLAARVWRDKQGRPWLTTAPPLLRRPSLKGKQARAYPLSRAEQERLFRELPQHLADAALFGVNTGCREQEICQLRWDWEQRVPDLDISVFVLPASVTKTTTERVVVLNTIAGRVVESRRGIHSDYVFTFRGNSIRKLHSSAWKRAWKAAGLPTQAGVLKGVHNLRHTFATRLRAAGVSVETRKALMGHTNGDITTHYSAPELGELLAAAERVTEQNRAETPVLGVVRAQA
jgi:integrase